MKRKPKILVVGSLVMDLIVHTDRFPQKGETVLGCGYSTASGGKGANQAVQAARLGAEVTMIGRVGEDAFGEEMIASLREAGVDTRYLLKTNRASSAIGNVQIELCNGQAANRIIVVPGANMEIAPADVAFLETEIKSYDMVLLQLEIPMEVNEAVVALAYQNGVPVMLNPAPYAPLSGELLSHAAYVAPNEHEIRELTGVMIENPEDAQRACECLQDKGCQRVLVTLGEKGAAFAGPEGMIHCPALSGLAVKDTTAAGDSFIAAFCVGIACGLATEESLLLATHTAGLTVCAAGAQPSLPTLTAVLAQMARLGVEREPFERLLPRDSMEMEA